MAEYWKSTPKYFCKFCNTFVRDTPLERRNHENTGKHQGAIQRSLRNLHRDTERAERDKQRAKDEVARLNGTVSGSSKTPAVGASVSSGRGGRASATKERTQATPEERKKQLAQLAAMGVAVPEDYRREVAMVGEWETVAVRVLEEEVGLKGEDDGEGGIKEEDGGDSKEGVREGRAVGVRKRRREDGGEGDEEDGNERRAWGSRMKRYPARSGGEEADIEALLGGGTTDGTATPGADDDLSNGAERDEKVKVEENVKSEAEGIALAAVPDVNDAVVKTETAEKTDEVPGAGIVFKKRKKVVVPK
ncbi:MAG: hypothetical protein M1820_000726 [Bogoriella megaspora]|nr:MAG: hypothetical protein M1820_000726 [Bogoriella megaspora]